MSERILHGDAPRQRETNPALADLAELAEAAAQLMEQALGVSWYEDDLNAVDLRTERTTAGLFPSPFEFKRYGRNGVEVSELLPQLGSVIDEMCVIRSMYTFNPTHTPGRALFHTGSEIGRASCRERVL